MDLSKMNLAQKMSILYRQEEEKRAKSKDRDIELVRNAVQKQVDAIALELYDNAMEGKSEVRCNPKHILPQTIDFFENEGFIVWTNSQVVAIRIPL